MRGAFLVILLAYGSVVSDLVAQNAGINTTSPHPSAALHVMETGNGGLLIPSVIARPAHVDGLFFYDEVEGNLEYSNGSSWIAITPVPSGTVIMWSGSVSDIPDGWVLCDGKTYNYDGSVGLAVVTPNLKGRFIVGYSTANANYNTIGMAYGFKTRSVSIAEMPSHSHSITSDHNHGLSFTGGSHSHDFAVTNITRHKIGGYVSTTAPYAGVTYAAIVGLRFTNTVSTTLNIQPGGTGLSLGYAGSGEPRQNRPEYYTLAFIMKL